MTRLLLTAACISLTLAPEALACEYTQDAVENCRQAIYDAIANLTTQQDPEEVEERVQTLRGALQECRLCVEEGLDDAISSEDEYDSSCPPDAEVCGAQ